MIRVNLTYTTGGSVPFDPTPTEQELTATRLYYAARTIKHETTDPAVNGDAIGEWVDLKGSYNLKFQHDGDVIPILDGPVKLNTVGLDIPYAKVWNFPSLTFLTDVFLQDVPLPYVTASVLELHPNGEYEGMWTSPYVGVVKYNMRAELASYEIPNSAPTLFKRTLVMIEVKADVINCYHDGVFKGSVANDLSASHSDERNRLGLLVPSNNSCWNVFSHMEWAGDDYDTLMENFDEINQTIVSRFNCGQMNPKPHATDLTATFNEVTRKWTAAMSVVNATQQQVNNATFMWLVKGVGIGSSGFFNNQTPVGGTTGTLDEADYLSLPEDDRKELTPYVSIGGWDFIKGETKTIIT